MKHHVTTAGLILVAAVCFLTGIAAGEGSVMGALLIVVAAVVEFKFWQRLRQPAKS